VVFELEVHHWDIRAVKQEAAANHGGTPGTWPHHHPGARRPAQDQLELAAKCPILSGEVAGSRTLVMVTMGEYMGTKSDKAHVSLKSA
jgi:hypothetical protein